MDRPQIFHFYDVKSKVHTFEMEEEMISSALHLLISDF